MTEQYRLPELTGEWKWFVDAQNPAKITLWVYQDDGVFSGLEHSSTKVQVAKIDAGINDPAYVARAIYRAAENSMAWGTWSSTGRKQQRILADLLYGPVDLTDE